MANRGVRIDPYVCIWEVSSRDRNDCFWPGADPDHSGSVSQAGIHVDHSCALNLSQVLHFNQSIAYVLLHDHCAAGTDEKYAVVS